MIWREDDLEGGAFGGSVIWREEDFEGGTF